MQTTDAITDPRAKAQRAIAALGIEAIAERIEAGETQTEIARSIGCSTSQVNRWLHADPQRSARVRDAMSASAESWLDKGMQVIEDAPGTMAEIQRARALAQECARRAAIRNPAYRERTEHTVTGQVQHAVAHMSMQQLEQIAAQALPMADEVQAQITGPDAG